MGKSAASAATQQRHFSLQYMPVSWAGLRGRRCLGCPCISKAWISPGVLAGGGGSSAAWGKHLGLCKQNKIRRWELPRDGFTEGVRGNLTALSPQDLSGSNFLGCPEVRIPANLKTPLLACLLTSGEEHLAAAHEIILPGAVWAAEICQQPVPHSL